MNNKYVKDLSKLGRNLKDVIIIDNSPESFSLQPENAIKIASWTEDPVDNHLYSLWPIIMFLSGVQDVRPYLKIINASKGIRNYKKALSNLNLEKDERERKEKSLSVMNNSQYSNYLTTPHKPIHSKSILCL